MRRAKHEPPHPSDSQRRRGQPNKDEWRGKGIDHAALRSWRSQRDGNEQRGESRA
jgi:hypothetical protein